MKTTRNPKANPPQPRCTHQKGETPKTLVSLMLSRATLGNAHPRLFLPALGLSFFVFAPAFAENAEENLSRAESAPSPPTPRSLTRTVRRDDETSVSERRERPEGDRDLPAEIAPIDGYGNNVANPLQGAAEQPFIRLSEPAYADGQSEPSGEDRPNAREISNAICAQEEDLPNARGATDYLWQWGQFIDHDIVETPTIEPAETFNITIPDDDLWFTPGSEMTLNRSFYEEDSSPREQVNAITAYIDGSMVYGSDEVRAYALRALDGTGRLQVTSSDNGDLLPYNFAGLHNAPTSSPNFFLAGDVRANEQVGLTALHTLFVREHNQWADQFLAENPDSTGEEAYQFARLVVTAEIQAITYQEFLPILLGPEAIPPYRGYDAEVDASIANEFGAAAYRMGHTMLSTQLLRLDADGEESEEGNLSLSEAFFDPSLLEDNGIDSILRGLAGQVCQELDEKIVDDVRNFLFGAPGAGGFDLASLNIQRGRDHGLPDYNTMRREARLRPARRVGEINPEIAEQLESVFESPEQVDLWIGCLSEPQVPDAMVGPLLQRILANQFRRLRDGDRFYYKNHLPRGMQRMVEEQTLATIIRRNTGIGEELQDDVFLSKEASESSRSSNQRSNRR